MRARDWVVAAFALAAIGVAIFAMGGVLRWTQALCAALTAIAVGATALSRRSFARTSPLVVLLGAATALTAIQLVPLPDAVADVLVPTTAALREDGTALLAISSWSAATADPSATISALFNLLTLLGIAVVALRMATSEKGRYRILAAIAAMCGLAAIITGLHKLLDWKALYGLYEPAYARPVLLGPLLNANSLACLMAVGAALGIGLAAHRKQPGWLRVIWLLVVAACGAVVVGTISRGGTLALAVGALVTSATLIAQRFTATERSRKRRTRFLSNALPIGILAGCVTVLVIWSNAGNVDRQLSELSFDEVHHSRSKFAAWRSAADLVTDSPWLGVGRGAFETSFTRVHQASGLATYSYLENEYLQAIVDWGIPGAILLAVALSWLGYLAIRRWRDTSLSAAALGALAVICVQSNVDFGLQFLGLAAPITALAATLAYTPLKDSERPLRGRAIRLAHAVILVVGAFVLMSSCTTTLDEDRQTISTRTSIARISESVQRHPLDYYGYAAAADLLSRAGDPRAIRLLNHAMTLHPTHPQLHRMAARMLYSRGYIGQSAIEYAAALRMTPDPRPLLPEILARFPTIEAASALPIDHPAIRLVVATLDDLQRPDVARAWLQRMLELRPGTTQSCELVYRIAQTGDIEAAGIAGRYCGDHLPDFQSRLAIARQLAANKGYAEAISLLKDVDTWQSRRDEKIDAWLVLCDTHRAMGSHDDAKRCLRKLDASSDMLEARRVEIIRRIDEINQSRPANGGAATP